MTPFPELREADCAEVTVLVDNYTDLSAAPIPGVCRRPPFSLTKTLLAEHGFSCLVRVSGLGHRHDILVDTGLSACCMLHNARQLDCGIEEVESAVLSHGHFDHTGGLSAVFMEESRQTPLVLHPDAFLRRRLNNPEKGTLELPQLDAVGLKKAGADLLVRKGPSTLAAGHLLVTGEVERITPFEKGFPGMEAWAGGKWSPDRILDDQAVVIALKDKGLIVISGCAHAGIINTVEYARKLTGIDHIHAVLGGFHLTGPLFAPVISPTIAAMKKISPDYLVPMHCTGWEAINRFAASMPGKCIMNTVGTTYTFG